MITRDKLDKMLDEYYALRGWDSDGKPTVETLRGLGLDDCVTKLQAAGLL